MDIFIKKSPTFQKSKADKDEESRKKFEQSLLQRQKRTAERSGATGLTKQTSRKNPKESATSSNIEKPKPEATNRLQKTVFKSSTIERLASTRTAKDRSTESKTTPSKKASQKENKVIAPTKKSPGKESNRQGPRNSKPSDTKGHSSSDPPQKEKNSKTDIKSMLNESKLSPQVSNEVVDDKNIEEVHRISLIEKNIDTPMLTAYH